MDWGGLWVVDSPGCARRFGARARVEACEARLAANYAAAVRSRSEERRQRQQDTADALQQRPQQTFQRGGGGTEGVTVAARAMRRFAVVQSKAAPGTGGWLGMLGCVLALGIDGYRRAVRGGRLAMRATAIEGSTAS